MAIRRRSMPVLSAVGPQVANGGLEVVAPAPEMARRATGGNRRWPRHNPATSQRQNRHVLLRAASPRPAMDPQTISGGDVTPAGTYRSSSSEVSPTRAYSTSRVYPTGSARVPDRGNRSPAAASAINIVSADFMTSVSCAEVVRHRPSSCTSSWVRRQQRQRAIQVLARSMLLCPGPPFHPRTLHGSTQR